MKKTFSLSFFMLLTLTGSSQTLGSSNLTPPTAVPMTSSAEALRQRQAIVTQAKERESAENKGFQRRELLRKVGKGTQQAGGALGKATNYAYTAVSLIPLMITSIPDPHAKTAGVVLSVTLMAAKISGQITSGILLTTGRLIERSQRFITINEILINQTVEAISNYELINEQIQDLISPGKSAQAPEEASTMKKAFGVIKGMPSRITRKLVDTSDALAITDKKGERGETLKILQSRLKEAESTAVDHVLILHIKLLQDGIKFIDSLLNKDRTIQNLTSQIKKYDKEANKLGNQFKINMLNTDKTRISTENAKLRAQINNLTQASAQLRGQIELLNQSRAVDPTVLIRDKNDLIDKIRTVEPLTSLAKVRYLQDQGFDNNLLSKEGMMQIVKRLDALKAELCKLKQETSREKESPLCGTLVTPH